MSSPRGIPYVVGQWVRGGRFYGRNRLISEILDGHRNSIWVLGTRRIGKTSLLKQLEFLTSSGERGFVPVFWDFQGADDPEELRLTFTDALLDAEDRLEKIGVGVEAFEDEELFAAIARLRRRLRSQGLSLLLLCDEVEELLNLHRKDASVLRKLRRVMQSQEGIRSVLCSSVRLCELAEQREDTSPFLHGFSPPLHIHQMSDDEARGLILQDQLPIDERPRIEVEVVETIRDRCDNHPYLIQLVCKRFLEFGDLDEVCREVAADRMVSYFFSVDFDMLSDSERRVLRAISQHGATDSDVLRVDSPGDSTAAAVDLQRLEQLGFVRRDPDRRYVLSSYFFRRWLEQLSEDPPGQSNPSSALQALTPTEADPTLSVQVVDDRYNLLERIGEGAAATVYKARDTLLDTVIALKLLRTEVTREPNALERVRQEILLPRDLAHPNVLRVYDLGSFGGGVYLTMKLVEGRTLAQMIAADAPLDSHTAATITGKIASALAAAHRLKVLHRDIKPGNILLDTDGEPFLADFGLARLIEGPSITVQGLFMGTPSYASPEQASVKPLDERSDIYSLGVVLFEMVTGRRPFEADSVGEMLEMHRDTEPPDPRIVEATVPDRLAEAILRCLTKDPASRFQTAEAFESELAAITADTG